MSKPSSGHVPSSPEYFSDQDLEVALSGLAGNPTDDAAAVLDILPGTRPLPLGPLVAAAAAAGIAAGWFLSTITPQVEPDIPVPLPVSTQLHHPLVAQIEGDAWISDDDGKETLLVQGMRIDLDTNIQTGKECTVFIRMPGSQVELRIAANTILSINRNARATLSQGTVWICVPENKRFWLDTLEGTLQTVGGSFAVEASRSSILASAYAGKIQFVGLSEDEIPLTKGMACKSTDAMVSDPMKAALPMSYLAWQAPMLLRAGRDSEILEFVYPLVDLLADDETQALAERNLRLMGSIGAIALVHRMYEISPKEVKLRRRCSALLFEIGDYRCCKMWMPNLNDNDPIVRANLVLMMERITGIMSGGDREFWQTATHSQRYDKIVRFRKKLAKFE